jgi:hypothetical protein
MNNIDIVSLNSVMFSRNISPLSDSSIFSRNINPLSDSLIFSRNTSTFNNLDTFSRSITSKSIDSDSLELIPEYKKDTIYPTLVRIKNNLIHCYRRFIKNDNIDICNLFYRLKI